MACYHPLRAYRTDAGEIVFAERGSISQYLTLPCGQCVGCRLERSKQWATRCLHEASLHQENAFITLTYSPENVPADRSLSYRPFQLFMKRLRKAFKPRSVRFYMCGEYGENFERPHFHACLFGIDFPDKVPWKSTDSGCRLFRSSLLESLWPFGFSSVGDVTFESAAYVARYIMKKINGDSADEHYRYVDPESGQISQRLAEFTQMSLKPGIGAGWFEKWSGDVYPHDYVIVRGRKVRPPRYYDRLLHQVDPETLESVRFVRELRGREQYQEQTPERLATRELVAKAALSQFPRKVK